MISKAVSAITLASMLSTTAFCADKIIINIAKEKVRIKPTTFNKSIAATKTNQADITSLVNGNTANGTGSLNLGQQAGVSSGSSNNFIGAAAAGNAGLTEAGAISGNAVNMIDYSGASSVAKAEALIASLDLNKGAVTATVKNIDMGTLATSLATAATTTGHLSRSNDQIVATAMGSGTDNYIVGDFSTSNTTAAAPGVVRAQTNTGTKRSVRANGDFVIGSAQLNTADGAIKASIDGADMSITAANGDAGSSINFSRNAIRSSAVANSNHNQIDGINANGASSFAIASSQQNAAAVSAEVKGAIMSISGTGINGSASMSNNRISASAVGNASRNIIRLR